MVVHGRHPLPDVLLGGFNIRSEFPGACKIVFPDLLIYSDTFCGATCLRRPCDGVAASQYLFGDQIMDVRDLDRVYNAPNYIFYYRYIFIELWSAVVFLHQILARGSWGYFCYAGTAI